MKNENLLDSNIKINPNKVLKERLVDSFGLKQYEYIIKHLHEVDISVDENFQKKCNGFYKIRRNIEWRNYYYELFERGKHEALSFSEIINSLYETTEIVEPSFSSKMCSTINQEKPIWDQYVLKNLGLRLTGQGKERLNNAISLYAQIEEWYQEFMNTAECKNCIAVFDEALPDYKWISATKKIDCFLWGTR